MSSHKRKKINHRHLKTHALNESCGIKIILNELLITFCLKLGEFFKAITLLQVKLSKKSKIEIFSTYVM